MKIILTKFSVLVMAVCATGMSVWGAIEWGTPQNIVGDADVSTNGVQRYGYSWGNQGYDSIVVNGQTFVPCGMGQGTRVDVVSAILNQWDVDNRPARDWVSNQTATVTCSQNYLNLLRRVMFNDGSASGTVELRNLIPGRRYEVQLWSTCCFTECVGSDLVLDGGCRLASSSGNAESVGLGQWVTGTFICPASGMQTFSVTGVTGKWMFVNALQVRDVTDGPIIQWEEPRDITDDTDVNTEGRLLYAYNMSCLDAEVNGVTFKGLSSSAPYPGGTEGMADFVTVGISGCTPDAYSSVNLSADYARLAKGGVFRDGNSSSLMLRNLVPGRSYLVQFWVSDSRGTGSHRREMLDGVRMLNYRTATGNGQCVVGRFRAVAPTQTIALNPSADDTYNPSAQWNAFQVRELTPWNIEWEPVASVTGEESVLTEGEGVWAYYWTTNTPVTVNGVAFVDAGSSANAIGTTGDITLEGFLNVNKFVDFFPSWETVGASTNLHHLLRFGVYTQKQRISWLHLHHLTPGCSYLLQIFASDQRGVGMRATLVDGRMRLHHSVNEAVPLGDYVVGRFTATAPDLTIPLSPLASIGSINSGLSAQINAIQLRRIGSVCEANKTNWSYPQVTDASDVATEGTLAYAYTYAEKDLTVNGVTFTGWTNGQRLGNDVDFSTPFTGRYNGFYAANSLAANDPYRTLLSNGVYVDSVADDITLTLKNLTIGHAYLVQTWVHDTRGASAMRYWRPDGGEKCYYNQGYVVGRFVAQCNVQAFTMSFMEKHAQLNALQVRDLGMVSDVTDGTLTLTENLTTNAIYSSTSLTITGPGALNATEGVFAPTSMIDVAWSGTDFVKLGTNVQALNGAADALARVWAAGGLLSLNGAVSNPLLLHVWSGATLAVGEGNAVTASALEGTGSCAGPGTLEFANPDACRTDVALGGGLTVRKTGLMDWWHYGSLDGATLLCETGTVWIADGAKGGAFGLAGRVNFLDATVAGTLTAVDDLETTGLVFGAGASLVLDGTAALHATDDLDLDGVAISVETARRAPDNVLVRANGTLSGTPSFTFAEKGYRAYFNADLNAWCAKHGGFVIYVR